LPALSTPRLLHSERSLLSLTLLYLMTMFYAGFNPRILSISVKALQKEIGSCLAQTSLRSLRKARISLGNEGGRLHAALAGGNAGTEWMATRRS
jgi:hypothetical protein